MLNKKLTDAEISKLEAWADMRKDLQSLSKEDKTILNQIDAFRKNKWEGMRLTATNATWKAECSACHIAYPPGLLPASSWKSLMGSLDKHFDTDASLDAKQTAEILDFLEKNAAPESSKTASTTPNLRITQTAWFKHEHDEVPAITWKKLKSPSNCLACHTQADQGNFDEHAVQLPK